MASSSSSSFALRPKPSATFGLKATCSHKIGMQLIAPCNPIIKYEFSCGRCRKIFTIQMTAGVYPHTFKCERCEQEGKFLKNNWYEIKEFNYFMNLYGEFEYKGHVINPTSFTWGAYTLNRNGRAYFAFRTDRNGFYDLGADKNPTINGEYKTLEGIMVVDLFVNLEKIK